MKAALVGLVALVVVGPAATARADVCDDAIVDPATIGLRAGAFDATRSACLRPDFEARVAGGALIDTPDFYGTLHGGLYLGIRLFERIGLEWGATIRVVDVTFAQTAVVMATESSYGPISVHGAIGRELDDRLHVAGYLRAEIPFTREILDPTSGGAQLAGLVTWQAHDRIALHGRAGLLGWVGASSAGTSTRGAGVVSADASIRTIAWLHALAGLEVQAGWHRSGVDHLAARAGAHWRVTGPWRVDLAFLVPVVGEERTDVVFTLGVRRDR